MKKFRFSLAVLLFFTASFLFAQETSSDSLHQKLDTQGLLPVFASDIEEGFYEVRCASSSSMFRIEKVVLKVKHGIMTAELTLSGQGYSNVAMLSAEDAESLASLKGTETYAGEDGRYVCTVPVDSLNTELVCSAFSKKKKKWYERQVVFYSDRIPSENLFVTPYKIQHTELKNGVYKIDVKLSGGSGKSSVESPAELIVKDGFCSAKIKWSSPNYDYMILNGEKILPLNDEGNSVFELPVLVFDKSMSVFANTTAMSVPHEILYQLNFNRESVRKAGFSSLTFVICTSVLILVILIILGGILCVQKKKK